MGNIQNFPFDKLSTLIYFAMQSSIRMNDLNRALGDISNIRRQMARSTEFHGYGPATLASTSVLAAAAAGVQAFWVPDPASHAGAYVGVWFGTAVLSASVIAVQTLNRA